MAEHRIEITANVYLHLEDGKWVRSSINSDGYPLDPAAWTYERDAWRQLNTECGCDDPEGCESAAKAALELPMPTWKELTQ